MTLGPLHYVVIGLQNDHGMQEIISGLSKIEETGALRVVDLLLISTDATGTVTLQDMSEVGADEEPDGTHAAGMLTAEDVQALATHMPAGATAVVVLLEHVWAGTRTSGIPKAAGGILWAGHVGAGAGGKALVATAPRPPAPLLPALHGGTAIAVAVTVGAAEERKRAALRAYGSTFAPQDRLLALYDAEDQYVGRLRRVGYPVPFGSEGEPLRWTPVVHGSGTGPTQRMMTARHELLLHGGA